MSPAGQTETIDPYEVDANQVYEIANKLMCPVCRGQVVGESNADLAKDMRNIIRTKLAEGRTEQEILEYFKSRYGASVLASPPKSGINLVLWLLPFVAIITGTALVANFLVRESSRNPTSQGNAKTSDDEDIDSKILDKIDQELKSRD